MEHRTSSRPTCGAEDCEYAVHESANTRYYDETIAYAVRRMNERAVHRESLGWSPEANYIGATGELAVAWELIGYVYRTDPDTVIEDIRGAAERYDGPAANLTEPDFLKGVTSMAIKGEKRRERIAGELRAHRAKSELSQADVGELVGIDKASVGRYEKGVACMDYETAWDMADLYGVSLDELGGRKFKPAEAEEVA